MLSRVIARPLVAFVSLLLALGPVQTLAQSDPAAPIEPKGEPSEGPPEAPPTENASPPPTEGAGAVEGNAPSEGAARQGIRGRVIDAATGEPIMEGQVQLVGHGKATLTDLDGYFTFEVPPGVYSVRAFYELYEPARVDRVEVKPGAMADLEIRLSLPKNQEADMMEVVVTARADKATEATQLAVRKESAAVRDNISAQEIARSGSVNAADAVRRVVSATVDPSNRLIVRGLGSRYTRVLVRGFRVPSTDPDDPGVELDLFPAGVLSNLSVVKTFTPDLPGDFAGGVMQIETREFPQDFMLQTNVSLGYNTQATFKPVLDYDGGSIDALGFDDGSRALPSSVPNEHISSRRRIGAPAPAFTPAQVEELGESFDPNYGVYRTDGLPNLSLGAVAGDTVPVVGKSLGYLVSFGYQNRTDKRVSRIQEAQGTVGENGKARYEAGSDFTDERGRVQALWGALATFNLKLSDQSNLSLTNLLSQSGSKETNFARGVSLDDLLFAQRRLRWIERQLFMTQLRGEHHQLPRLHRLDIDWTLTAARAARDEPDARTVRYTKPSQDGPYAWTFNQRSPGRFFSDLAEWTMGSQLDLALPVTDWVKLKAGVQTRHAWVDFDSRRFTFVDEGLPSDVYLLGPDAIFNRRYIGDGLTFQEGTINTDGYDARSGLLAGYAMGELNPIKRLRLIAGVRYERFVQSLEARAPTANQPPDSTKNVDDSANDVLPAAAIVAEVMPSMFVRTSYGMTVARPLFRELAPFIYEDDVRRISVSGNPSLERSRIHNVDVRWELFPTATEVLAVSGFYKKFIDPIEPYQIGTLRSFQNARGATNLGAELEARLSLGRVHERLAWFQMGLNLTYVHSRIQIARPRGMEPGNTSKTRPLSGQSPFVANLSLGIADPDLGSSLFVYYNVFGKRIDQVGANGLPDQYELPFHSLDLIGNYNITKRWSVRLNAKNLLAQQTRIKEGPIMRERFKPGTTLTLGAGFAY